MSPRDEAMAAPALIPGAFEKRPMRRRQPGGMGGPASGSVDALVGPTPMDAATIFERQKEGGGALSERRP